MMTKFEPNGKYDNDNNKDNNNDNDNYDNNYTLIYRRTVFYNFVYKKCEKLQKY